MEAGESKVSAERVPRFPLGPISCTQADGPDAQKPVMTRKYKFHFPLPGRKSNTEKLPVAKHCQLDCRNADDSPRFDPGDKARRLLGTSELASPEVKQKQSWRARQLKKYPSFMSGTTADANGGQAMDPEDIVVPEKMAPHETSRGLKHMLRNQPSSPLLGKDFMDDSFTWGSVTEFSIPNAQRSESSSTSRSYYDPLKSPLAISQQTSASSARDMALRKGCKPVASPNSQGLTDAIACPAVSGEDYKYDKLDCSKTPPQLDLSTLFPKPVSLKSGAPLPQAVIKSPSQISLASSSQRWVPTNRHTLVGQDRTKIKDYNPKGDEVDLKDVLRMDEHKVKMNAKRPNNGAMNWFGGLEEDDNEFDAIFPSACTVHALPEDPRDSVKAGLEEVSKDLRLRQRKSSISDPHRRPSTSRPTLSFRLDPAVAYAPTTYPRDSLQSSGLRSTASSVSRRSKRSGLGNRISLSAMDLINQSVLVLSSSSDDEIEQSAPRRRARIRDSIEVVDIGEEPLVYSAETMKASKPRPVVRVLSGRASNPRWLAAVPPIPKMPETPQLHQRTSSKKWGAEIKSKITSMKVVDDKDIKLKLASMKIIGDPSSSAEHSIASRSSTKVHRSATHKGDYTRGSKMMAVTEEEEKLLEAMRKKRASIRKVDFAEGFHEALQLRGDVEPSKRPKTSSADGRPTFFDSEKTVLNPPLGHGLRNSLTGAPFAASTNDLVHVDSYPFPETNQRRSKNVSSVPQPDPSPSLSFSPSDLLPSPPSSRLSPRTPPPGHGFQEVYAGGSGASPSRQLRFWDSSRHDRKQSASSGVLTVYSGDNRKIRDVDSEDGITGWTMDRW